MRVSHHCLLLALSCLFAAGCDGSVNQRLTDAAPSATDAAGDAWRPDLPQGGQDGAPSPADAGPATPDAGVSQPPTSYAPCTTGSCWTTPSISGICGQSSIDENFSTGLYNVHRYSFSPPKGVKVELTLTVGGGSWNPVLLIHDATGATVHDGEHALSSASLTVQPLATGKGGATASVRLTAQQDNLQLHVFVTGWSVVQGGFSPSLPKDATYTLASLVDCPPPKPGTLLSPPNFDPTNKVNGYYLLPQSQPPGLYTRKADDCSRGTKLLIDVLYTVATRWKQIWPSLSPISILDLNEGSCSTVNHATHDDGTHADIIAGCATEVACTDNQPAIDLAKLFVDTGEVCGIINNDTEVQAVVNAYFNSKFSYTPWHGTFMRSVSGHTHHFHIRVKKPDGSCN